MSDPQIWTLIGVFAAAMFGVLGLLSTMFTQVVRSEIGGLRSEFGAELRGLRSEMNARFESVDVKIDNLDRDVQALVRRVFPE